MGRQVRFDRFRCDTETGRLWAGAQGVRLTPKSAAVMAMLVGALMVLLIAVVPALRRSASSRVPIRSLAVLPLANLTGDPSSACGDEVYDIHKSS